MQKNLSRVTLLGACGVLLIGLLFGALSASRVSADTGLNWTGQYWTNTSLSGNPTLTRTDAVINFNWGAGSPDPSIPVHNFSVRWTLTQAFTGGFVTFRAGAEGGVRVSIDSTQIINQWHDTTSFAIYSAAVNLGAGNHTLVVEYYSQTGLAGVLFDWQGGTIGLTTVVPGGATVTPVITLKGFVRVDIANVRPDASTNNPPIAQVYYGDIYPIVAGNGDGTWYLIRLTDGREGWIFRRNLYLFNGDASTVPVTQTTITPPPPLADVEAVATTNVIVRDGPSRRNTTKKIGALNQGESFKVIALSRNHAWVEINTSDGLVGWVYVPFINVTVGDLGQLPVHN